MKKTHLKKLFKISFLSLTISSLFSLNVMAENLNQSQVTSDTSEYVQVQGRLIEIGSPTQKDVHSTPLKGFANNLPLLTVMQQITPDGWVVKKREGSLLNVNQTVSWSGGKNWVDTLSDICKNNHIEAIVNWNDKSIILSDTNKIKITNKKEEASINNSDNLLMENDNKQEHSKDIFVLEGSKEDFKTITFGKSEQKESLKSEEKIKTVVAKDVAPKPIIQTWYEDSALSLKENVLNWAKKAGYKVVWDGDNYAVDSRTLTGDFDADNGPIHQLSIDYGPKSVVKQPLSFDFYQNKTLVVKDLKYVQQNNDLLQ